MLNEFAGIGKVSNESLGPARHNAASYQPLNFNSSQVFVKIISKNGKLIFLEDPPGYWRVTLSIKVTSTLFIHLGGERHCESKVFCPRTQHNVPSQGSNPDRSIQSAITMEPPLLHSL